MKSIFKVLILLVAIGHLASAQTSPKAKKKVSPQMLKLAPKPVIHQQKNDPYLGFRPETDPTKQKLKPGPAKGKNVADESREVIEKQRREMNNAILPNGSDRLFFPTNR